MIGTDNVYLHYFKIMELKMITKIATSQPDLFLVFENGRMIGRFISKEDGSFVFYTKEIFKKYNGFGVNIDLLNNSEIPFRWIEVHYVPTGTIYRANIKKFFEKAVKSKFKEFTKIFLNINYFEIVNDPQLQFSFKGE
jgi:hypothetical protein